MSGDPKSPSIADLVGAVGRCDHRLGHDDCRQPGAVVRPALTVAGVAFRAPHNRRAAECQGRRPLTLQTRAAPGAHG